jgi:hypothetical protein
VNNAGVAVRFPVSEKDSYLLHKIETVVRAMKLTTHLHLVKNGGAILPFRYTSSWCGAQLIRHRDGIKGKSIPVTSRKGP